MISSPDAKARRSISARGVAAGAKQPVSGFSTITCLPARAALMASGAWSDVGTQRSTTSTSGAASTSSALAATAPTPNSSANRAARSGRAAATRVSATVTPRTW
jgi:hypothetical protein